MARVGRIDRWTALLAAIGALGAALVLLRTAPYGAEVGVDAAGYVSTAHSLLAGGGFVMLDGALSTEISMPGLPLTLALIGLFGPDPLDSVGYLHAAAFGVTVLVVAAWVRSRTRSGFLAVWAGLACALSPSLGGPFSTAMTDPLFICYATLSLYALDRCLAADGRRSLLLAAAVCAALACATRYMGVALVASAVPLLLLAERRGFRPAARGIANAAIFAGAALAPLGAVVLYNIAATGSSVYHAFPTGWNTLTALHRATAEFARWTLGEGGYARLRAIAEALPGGDGASVAGVLLQAAVPLAAAACAVAAVAFLRRRGRGPGGLAVPAAFAAVYATAVLFANWYLDFNLGSQPRYLAPLYPPLLAAAAIALGGLLREASMRGPRVRLPRRLAGGGGDTARAGAGGGGGARAVAAAAGPRDVRRRSRLARRGPGVHGGEGVDRIRGDTLPEGPSAGRSRLEQQPARGLLRGGPADREPVAAARTARGRPAGRRGARGRPRRPLRLVPLRLPEAVRPRGPRRAAGPGDRGDLRGRRRPAPGRRLRCGRRLRRGRRAARRGAARRRAAPRGVRVRPPSRRGAQPARLRQRRLRRSRCRHVVLP